MGFCCGYDIIGRCCVDRDKNLFPAEVVATQYIATGVIKSALTHEGFYHRRAEDYTTADFMPRGNPMETDSPIDKQFNTFANGQTWKLSPPLIYWDEKKRACWKCWL